MIKFSNCASLATSLFFIASLLTLNGQGVPRDYWQDMTTEDFAVLNTESVIAILPVAAIEQHGPHLPVCADACANKAVTERMLKLKPVGLPVTVLPMLPVGKSNEHSDFPGTLTLEPETLRRLWTEIAESVHRVGIRKLVLYNSHGGQPPIMDIVARDLRVRLDMLVVVVNQFSLYPTDLFPEDENKYGVHGGSAETSVMLYLHPDLVDMSKAQNFEPSMKSLEGDYQHLSATGPTRIAWQSQDLNPAGVVGNALDADAERGAKLIENAAVQFVSILKEVDRYSLSNLRMGPLSKE
ncbi:creatininase family protein [Robiginitalea sp. SC105]|uniref:creatininase family protein n=1 Tax=Robiginitalea sp. SC105 TaxID=2762332 RepID=UPI00163B1912|nr:creatininase family protein [Robiginitalea sp. SC105]MBC2838629.1 creatininase family protein [Robiginitalea sp. SC105]